MKSSPGSAEYLVLSTGIPLIHPPLSLSQTSSHHGVLHLPTSSPSSTADLNLSSPCHPVFTQPMTRSSIFNSTQSFQLQDASRYNHATPSCSPRQLTLITITYALPLLNNHAAPLEDPALPPFPSLTVSLLKADSKSEVLQTARQPHLC